MIGEIYFLLEYGMSLIHWGIGGKCKICGTWRVISLGKWNIIIYGNAKWEVHFFGAAYNLLIWVIWVISFLFHTHKQISINNKTVQQRHEFLFTDDLSTCWNVWHTTMMKNDGLWPRLTNNNNNVINTLPQAWVVGG